MKDSIDQIRERVWLAYHALPRDESGAPPPMRWFEETKGLSNGTIKKLVNGAKESIRVDTLSQIAAALGVSEAWLMKGGEGAPVPTGIVPPRPGAPRFWGEMHGWAEAVDEAKADARPMIPPEAFRAGAKLPIAHPCERVTPEIAIFVSGLAWHLASGDMKARYATEEARSLAIGRRAHAKRHGRTA